MDMRIFVKMGNNCSWKRYQNIFKDCRRFKMTRNMRWTTSGKEIKRTAEKVSRIFKADFMVCRFHADKNNKIFYKNLVSSWI
jgi:hypothetical protein